LGLLKEFFSFEEHDDKWNDEQHERDEIGDSELVKDGQQDANRERRDAHPVNGLFGDVHSQQDENENAEEHRRRDHVKENAAIALADVANADCQPYCGQDVKKDPSDLNSARVHFNFSCLAKIIPKLR
jgi:hypothetical protein